MSVRPDSSEDFDIEDNESQDRDDDSEDNSGVVDVEPDIQTYNLCQEANQKMT